MKKKLWLTFLISATAVLWGFPVSAQIKTWPGINLIFKNQFDKGSRHHGLWSVKNKIPGTEESIKTRGRYHHGMMVGTWRSHYSDKKLQQLEICTVADGKNILETTRYHRNGKMETKGMAQISRTDGTPRFQRFGEWKYFDEKGNYTKTINYENGWPVKTIFANGYSEISKPPKVFKPGESPKFVKKPGAKTLTLDKNGQIVLVTYLENGDSTITYKPANKPSSSPIPPN